MADYEEQARLRRLKLEEIGEAINLPQNYTLKLNLTVPPHKRPLRVYGTRISRPPLETELSDPQIDSLLELPPLYGVKGVHGGTTRPIPWRNGYFWGEPRMGKTWKAVCCLKGALMAEAEGSAPPRPENDDYDWEEWEDTAEFSFHGRYVSLQEWFAAIYAAFQNSPEQVDELRRKLTTPKYVVLDDLGATKATEFVVSMLEGVLDRRISDKKFTIVTGNNPLGKYLIRQFHERVVARLRELGVHHVTKRLDG